MKSLALVLRQKLASSIAIECYASPTALVLGNAKKLASRTLAPGALLPVYFGVPPEDKQESIRDGEMGHVDA